MLSTLLFIAMTVSLVNVDTTVSTSANTGGNEVSGNGKIETRDASAKSEAKTEVSGGSGTVKIESKVEANGEKSEKTIEKKSENEDSLKVEINQEVKSGGESEKTNEEIKINDNNPEIIPEQIQQEQENAVETPNSEKDQLESQQDRSFTDTLISNIKAIFNRITSIFS